MSFNNRIWESHQKETEDNTRRWFVKGWQNNYFYFLSLGDAMASGVTYNCPNEMWMF